MWRERARSPGGGGRGGDQPKVSQTAGDQVVLNQARATDGQRPCYQVVAKGNYLLIIDATVGRKVSIRRRWSVNQIRSVEMFSNVLRGGGGPRH